MNIKTPKKLIEVALPLDAINTAAAREKSIRHGHPSTLHLWWARRPLAAARAVIFAQMVNDPGYQQGSGFRYGVNKEKAAIERERLFKIIEDLVQWENTNNEEVLARARAEIRRSWRETCELNKGHPQAAELFDPERLPASHDPFAGGGAIPLEAQRLGLESYASDLNPVAVTINKAMIEIPPKFAGRPPVGPIPSDQKQQELHQDWSATRGLAEDIRRYGAWMRAEAAKRIGHLYPKVRITEEMAAERPDLKELVDRELTVIAWLWTRTIKCANPACGETMPLLSSFVLSSKEGAEAYLVPSVQRQGQLNLDVSRTFPTELGDPAKGFKRGMSGIFECAHCKTVTTRNYTAEQSLEVGLGSMPTALVCEGKNGRIYLPARYSNGVQAIPDVDLAGLDIKLAENPRDVWCRNFGLLTPSQLFTPRQLYALVTFSSLVDEAIAKCRGDARDAGVPGDESGLEAGGSGANAYAEAVGVYLALAVGKFADNASSLCSWHSGAAHQKIRATFGRQALPMTWDYAEGNPLSDSTGNFFRQIELIQTVCEKSLGNASAEGIAIQADAQSQAISSGKVISTDPPYYDNIGYADLSDYFYVWLRRSLRPVFPALYATLAAPKGEELIAAPYRHGGKEQAEAFFLEGMTRAMHNLAEQAHPAFPVTIYYAFKQSETKGDAGTSSTGWETFLEAVIKAGFGLTGTWPIRTELGNRMVGAGTNALASSIVLVCRKRASDAPTVSRREFIRELNSVLPEALDEMTRGGVNSPVAPVDLSQAIIGPGMAIFSQYAAVLEADGAPMRVKTALQLINRFLGEDDFDHDTQFCLHWFEQQGWAIGKFGEADVLARAKGTSVGGLQVSGVVESSKGQVRLLRWAELPKDWSPETDIRTPEWEALHQMIRALNQDGEFAAGALLARMPARAESIRALAYRLYTLCERKGWAEDARAYNELVAAWSGIEQASADAGIVGSQPQLDI
ncbi:DUF1156 domain-containing protein [Paraburkholderia rhynchosiae]|uniref:DUF1156 domain-containing protein n=1 Tax=Paraburkholderia rhynchosiae TaxID=487049 RepID=A0A2N7WQ59_9BURK|nr:DUF1156 domain-containing protein [Paraburkholderia rhynchosiae]PMS31471.1 hypothetical protein C0Z16_10970 [Paraburkholderia rhynchosiae]CAB3661248.1 hypothetical protein LMG27174_01648 [Paraburkholderia rhynchosiae]